MIQTPPARQFATPLVFRFFLGGGRAGSAPGRFSNLPRHGNLRSVKRGPRNSSKVLRPAIRRLVIMYEKN